MSRFAVVSSAAGSENPVISVKCCVPVRASGKMEAEEARGKVEDAEGMTAVSSMVRLTRVSNQSEFASQIGRAHFVQISD
jgi:hypothetical protein